MLIRHEGLKLKPYKCSANKLTIGVGRNIEDNGISESEAMLLLDNDVAFFKSEAEKFHWFKDLNEVRKDVVINMIFNLGVPRFLGFKKMIAAMQSKKFNDAAKEMLDSKWAKQVGKRAEELAGLMRHGEYKVEG